MRLTWESDLFAEIRRQEALERLAKRQSVIQPVVVVEVKKKPPKLPSMPRLSKVKVEVRGVKKKYQSPRPKITCNCPICGDSYQISPSLAERRNTTCGKKECTRQQRSLSQYARNSSRENPRKCTNPVCCNYLNPNKKHHQRMYCSSGCATRHRRQKEAIRGKIA